MVKRYLSMFMGFILVVGVTGTVSAEEMTAQLVKDKVIAASKVLEAEGEAAFAKFKDEAGEFRFGSGRGYVWVHNLDGIMVMHPIKPSLEGKNLLDLADSNGVYFFVAMNEVVEEYGQGWIPYAWPKPGEKASSPKISYCVLVKKGDQDYVVGSGMYDVTAADIKKAFPGDQVYEE